MQHRTRVGLAAAKELTDRTADRAGQRHVTAFHAVCSILIAASLYNCNLNLVPHHGTGMFSHFCLPGGPLRRDTCMCARCRTDRTCPVGIVLRDSRHLTKSASHVRQTLLDAKRLVEDSQKAAMPSIPPIPISTSSCPHSSQNCSYIFPAMRHNMYDPKGPLQRFLIAR